MSAAAVLDAARRELGTLEVPKDSNRTPYGKAYGWDGVAWCAIFVWWVFRAAGVSPLIPKTAGTVALRDWYRARGQWHTGPPQPGDLVFFKFAGNNNPVNHVGLVEAVEPGGTLITIEGNTAGTATGDQRNSGGVYRKRRTASIVGYARPAYSAPTGPGGSRPTLREGATGDLVAAFQTWLNTTFPAYSRIDLKPRRYGPQTIGVVREWQRRSGLLDDGVVGPASWAEAARQGFRG